MKHTGLVTFFLILVFILTQVMGLTLIANISSEVITDEEGNLQIADDDATKDITPKTEGLGSLLYIIFAVGIGTALLLFIVKLNKVNIWKAWFFLAVAIAVGITMQVILKDILPQQGLLSYIPWIIGGGLALLKIKKPNVIIYNLTEILMYSGIALILAPIFSITWAIILLLIISVYDIIAVWKSKHMVKMAQFQSNSNMFAGLMIPYSLKSTGKKNATKKNATTKTVKTAILGGGDVTFPLIFEGVVLRTLIISGRTPSIALLYSLIIVASTTVALTILFMLAKKDKFYPAMPFITAGCLAGWIITGIFSGVFF